MSFECTGIECRDRVRQGRLTQPNAASEPHTCPYQVEINEDSETLCTCCDDCTRECADSI